MKKQNQQQEVQIRRAISSNSQTTRKIQQYFKVILKKQNIRQNVVQVNFTLNTLFSLKIFSICLQIKIHDSLFALSFYSYITHQKMVKHRLKHQSLSRNQFSQQFIALFQKDIMQLVQGGLTVYIIRIALAAIFPLILFGLYVIAQKIEETNIEPDYHILNYKLPTCFYISGKQEKNFGSKINTDQCISLAYYPRNKYTDQLATYLSQSLNLEMGQTLRGFNSSLDYAGYKYQPMFAVEFKGDADVSQNLTEYLKNLTVMIYYNSTYTDYPHYFQQYSEEKITTNLSQDTFIIINPASSFPTILQYHVTNAIMRANNITYEPVIRQLPYMPTNISKKPKKFLSFTFTLLPILVQFIFTYLNLAHEKNAGSLDSLRLSGISDVIYHIETFVFQYAIYLIGFINQLYIIYLFPAKFDIYNFLNPGIFIPTNIIAGMYSTTLAMFLNIITTIRVGNPIMILFLALFLVWIIVMLMSQYSLQFDPSFMPVIVQIIVVLVYPFVLIIYSFAKMVTGVKISSVMNDETLQFVPTNTSSLPTYASFFKQDKQFCMLNENTFKEPSYISVQVIIFVQTICLFFGAWILGEWLPINSSACRPPWKLFTSNVLESKSNTHTYGGQKEEKEESIKKLLRQKKKLRQKLSQTQIDQCFAESYQKCDETAYNQTQHILSNNLKGNEVLIAQHLHKTFKRPRYNGQRILMGKNHVAVSSVSLKLVEGEIMGIAGRSGCGKSTTFSLLSGAIKPNSRGYRIYPNDKFTKENINNAWVGPYSIRNDMNHIRDLLGLCPQFNTNVFQDLTIHQNLILQCKFKKIPYYDHKRIAKSLLLKIGLWEWRDKKMKHLSGGMQRRVAIAMAMVSTQTKLIILDEPSTGLDPQTKRVIWSLIKSAARDKRKTPIILGTSMDTIMLKRLHEKLPGLIITSHDMDELDNICDSVNIMSSGQIVAAGTAIELKNKFGKGYVLSIICDSAVSRQQFKLLFEQEMNITDNQEIKLLDESGVMLQYSIELKREALIIECLQLIETYIKNKLLVCDFQLEKSSMDEVFINVGNIYDPSNGGNVFNTLIKQKNNDDQVQNVSENDDNLIHEYASVNSHLTQSDRESFSKKSIDTTQDIYEHDKIFTSSSKSRARKSRKSTKNSSKKKLLLQEQNLLELTSDSEIDQYYNDDTQDINKLSEDEIQKILSPPRYQPKIVRSLLYKMAVSDNLNRFGAITILLMQLVLLAMAILFAEWLIPFVMKLVTNRIDETKKSLNSLCQICKPIQALDVILPECEGFNAWSVPNICEYDTIFNYKQYQAPPTYYGTDFRRDTNTTNLYSSQQYPMRVIIFDKDQEQLGTSDIDYKLSFNQQGSPQIQNINLTLNTTVNGTQKSINLQQSKTQYKVTNSLGQPVNIQMKQKLLNSIYEPDINAKSVLNQFPVNPIAIQNYNMTSGKAINDFTITTDIILNNGYELYESSQELDSIYIKKLLEYKTRFPVKRATYNQTIIEYPSRTFSALSYTDHLNFQYLQQQMAKNVPIAYIDMDKYKSKQENVYRPFISTFLPGSQSYPFYRRYGYIVRFVEPRGQGFTIEQLFNSFGISTNVLDNIIRIRTRVLLAPSPSPTILYNSMEGLYTSPQTPFMDINARLSNSILRSKVNDKINIVYGVQMMKNTQIDLFANMSIFAQLGMSGVLVMIAVYLSMLRQGSHAVMDRQLGLRRQLFLNGVSGQTYWSATLLYIFLVNTVICIFVMIVARYIMQIRVVQTVDGSIFLLLILSGLVSVTSITMFISCFFKKQGYYIAVALLIIIISALSLFFDMDSISVNPPFYAYFIQSIAFVKTLVEVGFASYTMKSFVETEYFTLLIWTFIESGIMLILSYYFDQLLPNLNGYKPQIQIMKCKSSKQQNTQQSTLYLSQKSLQDLQQSQLSPQYTSVATSQIDHTLLQSYNNYKQIDNKIKVDTQIQLTPVPMVPQQKTQRDIAAMHDESRMDVDVIDERRLIKDGVPIDTTVLITNLTKYYQNFVAIRDLSFYLTPQERNIEKNNLDEYLSSGQDKQGIVFSLLGKNGACKSTLIKCMTGLEQQSGGKVYIHGYDMSNLRQAREAYKHIGLCSQFDVYLPSLTVRQHLHLFAAVHGVKWEEINNIVYKIAQFVELADVLDKKVQKLSGGMKRRLSLALALIG